MDSIPSKATMASEETSLRNEPLRGRRRRVPPRRRRPVVAMPAYTPKPSAQGSDSLGAPVSEVLALGDLLPQHNDEKLCHPHMMPSYELNLLRRAKAFRASTARGRK